MGVYSLKNKYEKTTKNSQALSHIKLFVMDVKRVVVGSPGSI